jgi:hypothetical protein
MYMAPTMERRMDIVSIVRLHICTAELKACCCCQIRKGTHVYMPVLL